MVDPNADEPGGASHQCTTSTDIQITHSNSNTSGCINKQCNCSCETGCVEQKTEHAPHHILPDTSRAELKREADSNEACGYSYQDASHTGTRYTRSGNAVDEAPQTEAQGAGFNEPVADSISGQTRIYQPSTEEVPQALKQEQNCPIKGEDQFEAPRQDSDRPDGRNIPEMYPAMTAYNIHSPSQSSQNAQFHQPESHQGQQQCYCIMPVPSGLSHAPFIYQCVPIPAAMPGTVAHNMPVLPHPPAHVPSPLPPVSQVGPSPGVAGPVDLAQSGMHTIATTLAQMKSSTPGNNESRPSPPSAAISPTPVEENKNIGDEAKPRPHACKLQDNWGRACKRTFTRPYDLYRHQETVHGSGSKSFCCGMCGCKSKKFSRQDSLARHIRRMHRKADPYEIRGLVATSAAGAPIEEAQSKSGVSTTASTNASSSDASVRSASGTVPDAPAVNALNSSAAASVDGPISATTGSKAVVNGPPNIAINEHGAYEVHSGPSDLATNATLGSVENPTAVRKAGNMASKPVAHTGTAYDTESEESSSESGSENFGEPRPKRLKTGFPVAAQTA